MSHKDHKVRSSKNTRQKNPFHFLKGACQVVLMAFFIIFAKKTNEWEIV